MRRVIGWLGRKAVLYILLVAAIAASTFFIPWVKQVALGRSPTLVRMQVLEDAKSRIESKRDVEEKSFRQAAVALRSKSIGKLDDRRRALNEKRARLMQSINDARSPWALALINQKALLAIELSRLRVAVIDQELAAISTARDAATSDGASIAAKADLARQKREIARLNSTCNRAKSNVDMYEQRWGWKLRQWWESAEHKALVAAQDNRCKAVEAAIKHRDRLVAVANQKDAVNRRAKDAFARATASTEMIREAGVALAKDAERARIEFSGSLPERLRVWAERSKLTKILRTAALALALIIAMPFLIRLFCFSVLAPIAMRRPAIRLTVPQRAAIAVPPAAPSTTSVAVRLEPGEELLVRQDYLQTSSHTGAKDTQWWLDWKKPITSIATGLTFLTRIRGEGEVTTVSAVRDGFAEVTILTLPEGAACVLQPRALAAVVQPIRCRLRITRHWRLGSLNAWLTLQLRYLVFHGPARLVLKGGRGVRVEAAQQGRVFGQDQLVGFSADLAYSVTRAETFWPYFLGREQLLKDRVTGGEGILIVEEAPLTARHGEVRRGIEGLIDAGMKVFGM